MIHQTRNHSAKKSPLLKTLFTVSLLQLALCNVGIAALPAFSSVITIGPLKNIYATQNTGDYYYKFTLPSATTVSAFLDGFSAGYKIELLDAKGNMLEVSANRGTTWNSPSDSGTTGGSVVQRLKADAYYIHVAPTA